MLNSIGMEHALHIIASASPVQNQLFPGNTQGSSYIFFIVFLAVIVTLRIFRGMSGRMYSNARVLRLPVVYTIITLLAVLGIGLIDNVILLTLALIPVGFLIGYRLGANVNFFTRNGVVFYKRSPFIMVVWLASLITRMVLELLFPSNLQVMLLVDSALSVTTGLIMGEAFNLISERKKYIPETAKASDGNDEFRINM